MGAEFKDSTVRRLYLIRKHVERESKSERKMERKWKRGAGTTAGIERNSVGRRRRGRESGRQGASLQ